VDANTEIRVFLASRRARLTPEQIGLVDNPLPVHGRS
jgi:hypothetical protein